MTFFKKKKIKIESTQKHWSITRECLNLILECAKAEYPNEFGGFLHVDTDEKNKSPVPFESPLQCRSSIVSKIR